MEASPVMENGNSIRMPEEKMMICTNKCEDSAFDNATTRVTEEKLMICASNCEDSTFHMEVSHSAHDGIINSKGNDGGVSHSGHDGIVASKGNDGDVEVDIMDNVDTDEDRVAEMEPQDGTESSSSFGCTEDYGIGSPSVSTDMEVESQIRDNNTSLLRPDGFGDLFRARKKKLTAHWRKFIRPLMWRCKWVELQLRELHSQACKYDRELCECEKRKQSLLAKCATEELGLKSTPFISQNQSVNLMKRKKRKRVEETVDMASYTSCHSLFSYYVSRKPIADSIYMDDDHGNTDVTPVENSPFGNNELGINAEWASFEFKDCNAFESILRKIEEAQLQVRQLRARMDKVVREHAGKFTSSSIAPGDQFASCALNSVSLCVNREKFPPGSLSISSPQVFEKLVMPESAVNGSGGAVPLPDMVESTGQAQTGRKFEKMELKSQIHNQPLKERLNKSEEDGDQHKAVSQLVTEVPDPSNGKMPVNGEQPTVKVRSISKLITPRNKRKRGRRKALSGRWSRKSSG